MKPFAFCLVLGSVMALTSACSLERCGRGDRQLRDATHVWDDAAIGEGGTDAELPDAMMMTDADLDTGIVLDAELDAAMIADAGDLPDAFVDQDAGPPDSGLSDTGVVMTDAGLPDSGPPDSGPPDSGPPDSGPPDAGSPNLIIRYAGGHPIVLFIEVSPFASMTELALTPATCVGGLRVVGAGVECLYATPLPSGTQIRFNFSGVASYPTSDSQWMCNRGACPNFPGDYTVNFNGVDVSRVGYRLGSLFDSTCTCNTNVILVGLP